MMEVDDALETDVLQSNINSTHHSKEQEHYNQLSKEFSIVSKNTISQVLSDTQSRTDKPPKKETKKFRMTRKQQTTRNDHVRQAGSKESRDSKNSQFKPPVSHTHTATRQVSLLNTTN